MSLEERVKALEDVLQRITVALMAPPQSQPKQSTLSPAELANKNTDAVKTGFHGSSGKEGDVCPECGGPKKPNFNQCFKCWEKKRGN